MKSSEPPQSLGQSKAQENPKLAEETECSVVAQRKKGQWSRKRKWPEHAIVGTLFCETCGKQYPAKRYQIRRNQRFCSGECRYHLTETERFWKRVEKSDGCWNWTGAKVSGRYGNAILNNKPTLAHRMSWQIAFGSIPDGMNVLHKCDNGLCVNPFHLFLGTQFDNVQDCITKGRSSHPRGENHPNARLDDKTVRKIKRMSLSPLTHSVIAKMCGVKRTSVSDILNGRSWKHVAI